MKLGNIVKQISGYKAFIPLEFPPSEGFDFTSRIINKASQATLTLGKLDGITQLLPNVDFFLFMYICKDAASSSQIEGTNATMVDAIEATSKTSDNLPEDVDDIIHYINSINNGIIRLKELPLSLRLIKEVHKTLMTGARATHNSDPGNFRKTQNWIGGTNLNNAAFVPPPVEEMKHSMGDLEKFIHYDDHILPILKAGIIHGQFETIHPFLDGNGRTGRLLILLYLIDKKLLDYPVLFLSHYFKKHQQTYYDRLNGYHNERVEPWLDFFLDGVIETSEESIMTAKKITKIREEDMKKMHSLGKIAAETSLEVLLQLFKLPIVNVNTIKNWTKFTRQGAQKVIDRFVDLDILKQKDENNKYGRSFIYKRYVDIFKE